MKPGSKSTSSSFPTWKTEFSGRDEGNKSKVHPTHLNSLLILVYCENIHTEEIPEIKRVLQVLIPHPSHPLESRWQFIWLRMLNGLYSCQHHSQENNLLWDKAVNCKTDHFTLGIINCTILASLTGITLEILDQMIRYQNRWYNLA